MAHQEDVAPGLLRGLEGALSDEEISDEKLNSPDCPSTQCESFFDVYEEDSPLTETKFLKDDSDMDGGRDESIAMDLDYDNLMAYFDSLKESNA